MRKPSATTTINEGGNLCESTSELDCDWLLAVGAQLDRFERALALGVHRTTLRAAFPSPNRCPPLPPMQRGTSAQTFSCRPRPSKTWRGVPGHRSGTAGGPRTYLRRRAQAEAVARW